VVGKKIARKNVKMDNLVKYGEILIASVGTLGENETFCRTIFSNEEFENQLVFPKISSGLYYIKVYNNVNVYSKKIIKN
jgi:hypothetical protein